MAQEQVNQAFNGRPEHPQPEVPGQAQGNHKSFWDFVFRRSNKGKGTACVVFLIVTCIVLVAVVPPVCVLKGCGAGRQREGAGGEPINRLIVNFDRIDAKSIKERVPVLLHSYFDEAILLSSGIHVVSFADAGVLEEVRRLLLKEPDLANLLRDSAQSRPPQVDVLAGLGGGGGGLDLAGRRLRELPRRSMQAGGGRLSGPDALYAAQFPYPYNASYVNAMGAWNITRGAPEVIVAVIDTGCDITHPDLKDNLWVNAGEVSGSDGVDDDGNGFIDDVHGYDFAGACENDYRSDPLCGPRPSPQDQHSHGTHCAGIIAAVRNNGIGTAGIAPNVKVMCLKVTPIGGAFYTAHIIKAYDYALKMGAHVVSCSFGPIEANLEPTETDKANAINETNLYKAALAPLVAKNMLIVVAAGNEDTDLDRLEALGTTYNPCTLAANTNFSSNMLCVMATNERGVRWHETVSNKLIGSNFGSRHVSIGAPGRNICSTVPPLDANNRTSWGFKTGSSMATPLTAGVGALVLSVLGNGRGGFFRGKEALKILVESGDPTEPLTVSSDRQVNAASAVEQALASLDGFIAAQPLAGFVRSAQSVVAEGLAETYFHDNGTVLARGVRIAPVQSGAVSRFDSYKRSTDCTLVIKAILELPLSDFYKIQVSTGANVSDLAVLVGQKSLNLTSLATGAVNTIISAGGFYEFELRYRNPSAPIDMTVTEPSGQPGAASQPGARFLIATAEEPKHYYYAPDIALSSAFQVLTRPPPSSGASIEDLSLLQLDQKYSFSSVVEDLNFSRPGELASALYPALYPAAVVGLVHTRLRAPDRAMRFRVTCAACWLSVNGLLLLDVYDARAPGSTRLSGCVDRSTSAAATHDLLLRFSLADTATAVLMLSWLPCDADPSAPAAPLTSHVMNNLLWKPASGVAGYLPGMQCDVWAAPVNHPPYPFLTAPLVKFRLPTALAHTPKGRAKTLQGGKVYPTMYEAFTKSGCNGVETANGNCSASVAFKLTDFIFSQATSTLLGSAGLDVLYMRCWTYINRGYRSGNMQPLPSTVVNGLTALSYLGSQQLFSTDGNSGRISTAPNITSLPGGYYQLLAMEWRDLGAAAVIAIVDGTNSSSDFLQLDMRSTLLPIPVVAQRDPSALVFDGNAVAAGAGGAPVPPGPSPPSTPRPPSPSWPTHPSRPSSPPTAPTAAATTATTSITNTTSTPTSTPSNTTTNTNTTNTTSASVSQRRSRSLLQLRPDAGGYRPQALGASAYSLAQVSDPTGLLLAGIYSPNATLFNQAFPFLGTFVLNNISSSNISVLESRPSNLSLAGVLPGPAPAPVSKARYVRAAGFVRPPSTDAPGSRSMRTWHVRVRDLNNQALTVTLGNVTLRNGVEFPSVSLNETLTEVTLPPGWVPVVVVLRSQRTDVAGEFSVSLLDPAAGDAETKVNGSYWRELKPV